MTSSCELDPLYDTLAKLDISSDASPATETEIKHVSPLKTRTNSSGDPLASRIPGLNTLPPIAEHASSPSSRAARQASDVHHGSSRFRTPTQVSPIKLDRSINGATEGTSRFAGTTPPVRSVSIHLLLATLY